MKKIKNHKQEVVKIVPKYNNWKLITGIYYLRFLSRQIPDLIQIITLPSALGIIAELNNTQVVYLSFITGILLSFFLATVTEDSYNHVKEKIWTITTERKKTEFFWNLLHYSTVILGGIIVYLLTTAL